MGSLNLDGRDIQVNYSGQKPPSTFGAGAGQGSYGAKPAYGGSQGGYGGSSSGGDKHTCFTEISHSKFQNNKSETYYQDVDQSIQLESPWTKKLEK